MESIKKKILKKKSLFARQATEIKTKKAVTEKRRGETRREEEERRRRRGIKDEMLSTDNPFTPKHTLRY